MTAKTIFLILVLAMSLGKFSWAAESHAPEDEWTEEVRDSIDDVVLAPRVNRTEQQKKKLNEAIATTAESTDGAILAPELVTAALDFAQGKSGEELRERLWDALPDKPKNDGTPAGKLTEIARGLRIVFDDLPQDQQRVLRAALGNGQKPNSDEMAKLQNGLKFLVQTTESKNSCESNTEKMKENWAALKALKALESRFASKAEDNDASANADKAKPNESPSPVRKGPIPETKPAPSENKVQLSYYGPSGLTTMDGEKRDDGVHATVKYPTGGDKGGEKSVDVVVSYQKDKLPKGVTAAPSAPISISGPGLPNKSFPTVTINNEPYVVTKDGYVHYKFADFVGGGAAATPGAKSATAVPDFKAVAIDLKTLMNEEETLVQEGKHQEAYNKSLKIAEAALAGKLEGVQWHGGQKPSVLNTKNGPVLVTPGSNGPELVLGVIQAPDGKWTGFGTCINCTPEFRDLNVFTDGVKPVTSRTQAGDHGPLLGKNDEMATHLRTIEQARQSLPKATISAPTVINPVDVSSLALSYTATPSQLANVPSQQTMYQPQHEYQQTAGYQQMPGQAPLQASNGPSRTGGHWQEITFPCIKCPGGVGRKRVWVSN